ncbi:MAG: MBL fold metallo-hydrolase [Polyangiaceae bacterium]
MDILQLRNATVIVSFAERRYLVDLMLSKRGRLPGFKLIGGGRKNNPLVELPPNATQELAGVTDVIITHEHPDHFDRAALHWIQQRNLPVWANSIDAENLKKKGLDVRVIDRGLPTAGVEVISSKHGRGWLGWAMGPVAGYFIAPEREPSLYLIGDSILTDAVLEAIDRLKPDVIVAPAGSANMGVGGDILFSIDELLTLARRAPGVIVFNHLEALDHCPTTRAGLTQRLRDEGLLDRARIPHDGERIELPASARSATPPIKANILEAGLQKRVTALFSGTP